MQDLVVNFFEIRFFCVVVAMSDLCVMWKLYMAYVNCIQDLEIFSEIRVMPMKLQFSGASLIFQKIIPAAVSRQGRKIASTSCSRSNIASTNQNNLI